MRENFYPFPLLYLSHSLLSLFSAQGMSGGRIVSIRSGVMQVKTSDASRRQFTAPIIVSIGGIALMNG